MESSSTKRNQQNVPQEQFGLEIFNLQRPQLPRDSRGSLEVFQPQALRAKSDNCPPVVAPESKLDSAVPLKRNRVRDQVFPKDSTRSVESRLDLETGCLSKSQQGTVLRAAARSPAPVFCDLDPRAQHKHGPSRPKDGSLSNQAEEQNIPEERPLTEDVAAERAAGWGLVLKAEAGSGKIKGVGVRNSGDSSQRNSGTSSCIRTSEESDEAVRLNPHIPRVSEDLKDALSSFQQTFVVADATRPDYPILYASAGFFNMTGYTAKEVIGRNCRFLQGADTDPADVSKIRQSLEQGKSFCGRILNYKKDGTAFWNLLTIAPIKDENGKILKYIGMLVEVSKFTEGSKDKALRPNGLPESLIKYDARQKTTLTDSVTELVEVFKKPISLQGPPLVLGGETTQQLPGKRVSGGNLTHVSEASPVNEKGHKKKRRSSSILSFLRFSEKASGTPDSIDLAHVAMTIGNEVPETIDDLERKKQIRRGIDLATTLERIEKNFVITDPRLPDNPIIFASDSFLELTEYSREEILGKNCRFLQGPDTNPETVKKIRDAIREQRSVTVQLLNYTKSGKPFWNLFHLQPMRDNKGELQYLIGVQLDGSAHFDSARKRLPETIEQDGVQVIQSTAGNVDNAVRELPDANQTPEGLWARYSNLVLPKPHKVHTASWAAINKIVKNDGFVSLKHFRPVKSLGFGDTGGVHLVELRGTGQFFAMKVMDKSLMLTRNKVHRTFMEREILDMMDHPFLPTLYASFQTDKHVCLITDFCPGGELFLLLDSQPSKTFHEDTACFYAAEVIVALEYLHCKGVVYRDLKPENILIQSNGHLSLADFDLSFLSSSSPQLIMPAKPEGHKKSKGALPPMFVAEPVARSNSFVGTEEYIAPEVINGSGHSSAVDWWALGILLYEMLYGWTPFRGKNRQKTFSNVLHKDVTFPSSIPTSLAARQLIHGLLQKDPAKRLGSSSGANELKRQPFFSDIYWPLIRCLSPPKLDTPLTLIDEFKMKDPSADAYDVF